MDDGTGPIIQSLRTTSDSQRSEERNFSESSQPEAAAALQEASPSAECNTLDRPVPATAQDEGGHGTIAGSGSDAAADETHNAASAASSASIVAACDDALQFLQPGEMDPFLWLNRCQSKIKSVSRALRKFFRRVLASRCVGNTHLQSIVRNGGHTQLGDYYDRRFQAIDEYILFVDEYYAVPKRDRIQPSDEPEEIFEFDENEETEVSSDEVTPSSSKDFMERVVANQGNAGTSGAVEVKGSEADAKSEMPEKDSELKRKRAISSSAECVRKLLKTDGLVEGEGPAGEIVNLHATQQELATEDVSSGGGEDDRESRVGGAEKAGDQTSTSSRGNEGDAVEEGHREPAADNSSSAPDEASLMEADKLYACNRARIIRKLVTRQGGAVSRMNKRSELRTFRMFRECKYVIMCLKSAVYMCNAAMSAHRMAHIAFQIGASSGARDVVDTLREAEESASQYTGMALASCESAVRLHRYAARFLEGAIAPLLPVMDDTFLARLTVRQVTTAAEEVQQLVDRADVTLAELANKLSLMESMIDTLSEAYTRAKNVNMVTEHIDKKFDDATFPVHAVSTVFDTTCSVLKAMTAATNALASL